MINAQVAQRILTEMAWNLVESDFYEGYTIDTTLTDAEAVEWLGKIVSGECYLSLMDSPNEMEVDICLRDGSYV